MTANGRLPTPSWRRGESGYWGKCGHHPNSSAAVHDPNRTFGILLQESLTSQGITHYDLAVVRGRLGLWPGPRLMERTQKFALAGACIGAVVLGLKYAAYWVTGSIALYSDVLESIINV